MLERTVGCREQGSLQRLLRGSQKSFTNRRTLHSGFWNQSVLELEPSPLYSVFLRGLVSQDRDYQPRNQAPSVMHAGFHLDFLYPTGTIRLLRQYAGWGLDRQDEYRARLGPGRAGNRSYASSAMDSPAGRTTATPATPSSSLSRPSEIPTTSSQSIQIPIKKHLPTGPSRDGPSDANNHEYNEAWEKYLLLDVSGKNKSRRGLIRHLAKSKRVVEAERIIELFKLLDTPEKDIEVYATAVRSYLRLHNLADATTLYNNALDTLQFPAGAAELLSYMVEKSLFSEAVHFWIKFQEILDRSPLLSYNIYSAVESHSDFIDPAIKLAEYVNMRVDASLDPPETSTFASKIVKTALMNAALVGDESQFMTLLQVLQKWDLNKSTLYDQLLTTVLELKYAKFAVNLYRKVRETPEIKLSRPTLHSMLEVFCDTHSVKGIQQVLDDFFHFYSHPTPFVYRKCMTEFASQGDSKTVHALFEQFMVRSKMYGKGLEFASDMAPILHVHAKRGELAKVVKYFNELQTVYGLEPDILCWNILIDAHAKVHDSEGAFRIFEDLLESKYTRPDAYTFGTIMGIYASTSDIQRVVDMYQLSLSMGIETTTPMIDCLVHVHIQHDNLREAEQICEDALRMNLKGPKVRMWNYLLIGHGMQRDIIEVNRILRRMSEARLAYDQYTYSAMMQALAMVRQPERAYEILEEVMTTAGIRRTAFHYATIMGAFLAVRDYSRVAHIYSLMKRRSVPDSASTKLLATKAADMKMFETGTPLDRSSRALEMFQETLSSMDQREISSSIQKGVRGSPRHTAYPTMFYSYVMHVLSQCREYETVEEVYNQFLELMPEDVRAAPPIDVLSALMLAKKRDRDMEGVQELWVLALSKAMAQARPLRPIKAPSPPSEALTSDPFNLIPTSTQPPPKIAPIHQLLLSKCLMLYMSALSHAGKANHIETVINELLQLGFLLDNKNWNHYIQLLARKQYYKRAFYLCETRLMGNWTGWARERWKQPVRNRLPIEIRAERKKPLHLRPNTHTFLVLGKAYLDLQSVAGESKLSRTLLKNLRRTCPKTIKAIVSMPRLDDALERSILGSA